LNSFPDNFLWGAATSAYQVEGSPLADGAGPSIWHQFSHSPGKIYNGDTGNTACDHYRRYRQDVQLMQGLGLNAYRFSVAWGRVLPEGRGRVNGKGLDFYQRLVDALLEGGMEPFVTLYHWDLPLALDQQGGWLNRDSAAWFGDYAELVFRALDDRVRFWTTLNEPWVIAHLGHLQGLHPPGRANLTEMPLVSHHLLRAHARAVEAYRAMGRGQIGIAVNLEPQYAASEAAEAGAARDRAHAYLNQYYLDPILLGHYPECMGEIFGEAWQEFSADEVQSLRQPIDFVGINYYSRSVVQHCLETQPTRAARVRQADRLHTELDWEVYPAGLLDTLLWVKGRYGDLPLYLTENGAAFADPPVTDGRVDDPLRVAYLRDHLLHAHQAIRQGVNLRGYFVWSLLDNFEWQHGYSKRFGIVHVDFETQQRTLKQSAEFYRRVIESRGRILL